MPSPYRRTVARKLAETIRQAEDCEVFTNASFNAIESSLSDYAINRLSEVRQQVVTETMEATAKQRSLTLLSDAIQDETK